MTVLKLDVLGMFRDQRGSCRIDLTKRIVAFWCGGKEGPLIRCRVRVNYI